jgi:hypothetical protein
MRLKQYFHRRISTSQKIFGGWEQQCSQNKIGSEEKWIHRSESCVGFVWFSEVEKAEDEFWLSFDSVFYSLTALVTYDLTFDQLWWVCFQGLDRVSMNWPEHYIIRRCGTSHMHQLSRSVIPDEVLFAVFEKRITRIKTVRIRKKT